MPPRGRETLIVRHGPVYDHFAHRWCLKGELLDGTQATTIIDLAPDRHTARIHPAAIPTYSLTLIPTDIARLATVCRTPSTAAFTSASTSLTVTHTTDCIVMASATTSHALTITYRHNTAAALAVITAELQDMLPRPHAVAS
ncbi:hypothetical protein [Actinokineospora cianjurensis]|uniref:Uncharacterized protein n=1 Tax=Actinokineospora cianjurensis TaxID=585224 RepID=A0A421B2S1_9PSEU|nr:hypothetical protein [Actinokineospora cianjurensis]RLK58691.1 hypothetical protein CLV68_3164 [Actinokineospora cianjurensis]